MSVADMTSEFPGLGVFGRLRRHVGEKVNIPEDLNGTTRPMLAQLAKTTRESRCYHTFGDELATRFKIRLMSNIRYGRK